MIRPPMTLKLEARPYRIHPRSLGGAAPGIDLDRSLRLAEALEDDARTRKHLNPLPEAERLLRSWRTDS